MSMCSWFDSYITAVFNGLPLDVKLDIVKKRARENQLHGSKKDVVRHHAMRDSGGCVIKTRKKYIPSVILYIRLTKT